MTSVSPSRSCLPRWPIRIFVLLPALELALSTQRTRWIIAHQTRVVTAATAIEAVGLAVALFFTIGPLNMPGAFAGALAMIAGRLASNAFLARAQATLADA